MKAFLLRALYAGLSVVIFFYILPLFLVVIKFNASGPLWQLISACVACLALVYLFFGPKDTPSPW
jgi:hypothetical protein